MDKSSCTVLIALESGEKCGRKTIEKSIVVVNTRGHESIYKNFVALSREILPNPTDVVEKVEARGGDLARTCKDDLTSLVGIGSRSQVLFGAEVTKRLIYSSGSSLNWENW